MHARHTFFLQALSPACVLLYSEDSLVHDGSPQGDSCHTGVEVAVRSLEAYFQSIWPRASMSLSAFSLTHSPTCQPVFIVNCAKLYVMILLALSSVRQTINKTSYVKRKADGRG